MYKFLFTFPVWRWCWILLATSQKYLPALTDWGKQRRTWEEEKISVCFQRPVSESCCHGWKMCQCSQMVEVYFNQYLQLSSITSLTCCGIHSSLCKKIECNWHEVILNAKKKNVVCMGCQMKFAFFAFLWSSSHFCYWFFIRWNIIRSHIWAAGYFDIWLEIWFDWVLFSSYSQLQEIRGLFPRVAYCQEQLIFKT